jgi:hypothetical protein
MRDPGSEGSGDVAYQTTAAGTSRSLDMQVVRAIVAGDFWKQLSLLGSSTMQTTITEAASLFMNAIRAKERMPPALTSAADASPRRQSSTRRRLLST